MQLDQLLDLLLIVGVSLRIATFFKSKSTWSSLVKTRTPIIKIISLVRNTIAHASLRRYHPLSVFLQSIVRESGTGYHSISSILTAKVCIGFIHIFFINFLRFEFLNEAAFRLSQSWPINIIERSRLHDYGIFFNRLF